MTKSKTKDADATPKQSGEIVKIEDASIEAAPLLKEKSPEKLEKLNKSVLRKLDWKFLPCITAMLLMNYLDRINVSNAHLAGMQEDLLFYVGYIISQVPANIMIAQSSPRFIMPCVMLGWSAVTICMPAVKSAWGFMPCRFLVGVTEGPFVPVVALM